MQEARKQSIMSDQLKSDNYRITNPSSMDSRHSIHVIRQCLFGLKQLSYLLIFLSALNFSKVNAQTTFGNPNKVSFSLRAGLNIAQVFGAGSQAFNHFGFSGGVKMGWRFSSRFSMDPEILYNMKGAARYPNVDKGDYYSFSVDLDYIEMPILFNYYFRAGKKAMFSFEFGPSIGFLVRQKAYENGAAINSTNTGFNIYDISLVAGLNYYLPKGFALNFRYMNSIAPIMPTSGSLPWGVSSINIGQLNSVLNFSVQYTFDFKKKEKKEDGTEVIKEKKKKKEKKQKGDVIDEE